MISEEIPYIAILHAKNESEFLVISLYYILAKIIVVAKLNEMKRQYHHTKMTMTTIHAISMAYFRLEIIHVIEV